MEEALAREYFGTTVSNCEPVGPMFKVESLNGVGVLENEIEFEITDVSFKRSLPLTTR